MNDGSHVFDLVDNCGCLVATVTLNDVELERLLEAGFNFLLRSEVEAFEEFEEEGSLKVEKVIFNNPVTVVFFNDGDKVLSRTMEGDLFDPEVGVAMTIAKKVFGSRTAFKKFINKSLPQPDEDENYTIFDYLTFGPVKTHADMQRDTEDLF